MNNLTPETIKSPHNVVDIANGRENFAITLVNEVNDECPPPFHYIRKSLVFENAYVNFSLARIGDQSCCSSCSGDCLSASNPCVCAIESGAEFAYTADGLVKEKFLEECISMARDPKKHCQFFCKECPLERAKGADNIEPCKGHLIRKFIKECWSKCGCHTRCGNRVIQRGISYNLQVFMTSKEKGWGLRTLVDLPKGAFVCEYAGEILTNSELYDRELRRPKGERHTYPMLLDADWGAEGVLKDDEALCLDTTYYGNVGRFINHRCGDSNLVDIPVEVETSDHHIYHVAFFTTRKVKAMEELTWDYGIDFDNHDHPIKAFPCQCGSKFCYNKRRSRMDNQKAIVPNTPQVDVSIVVGTRHNVGEEYGERIVYESRTKAKSESSQEGESPVPANEFHPHHDGGARKRLCLTITKLTKAVLQFKNVMSRIGKAEFITYILKQFEHEHLLSSQDAQPYQNAKTDEKLEMEFHTRTTKKVVLALIKMTEAVVQFRDAMSRIGKEKSATYILKKILEQLLTSQDASKPEPSDVQPNHKPPPQKSPTQNDLWDDDFFNQTSIANALFRYWDVCSGMDVPNPKRWRRER